MSQRRVLVAGATGGIGARVVKELAARGVRVRAAVRLATLQTPRAQALAGPLVELVEVDAFDPDAWTRALEDVDVAVSTLGASVALLRTGRASYSQIDVPAHRAIALAAQDARLERVVYLSAQPGPGYAHTRYVKAHLEAEALLSGAVPSFTAVRPTGIFTALDDLLDMARRGLGFVMGDGRAKTNPIHPDDVSAALLSVLDEGPAYLPIGGPEVMTRREIVDTAFRALGRAPRVWHLPAPLLRLYGPLLSPLHPRLGDLFSFAVAVSTHDAMAPAVGSRTLFDYYSAKAAKLLPATAPA